MMMMMRNGMMRMTDKNDRESFDHEDDGDYEKWGSHRW